MESIDNGSVGLTLEWTSATVRMLDHAPTSNYPPYTAAAQVTRMSEDAVKISGLCGSMTRSHIWLLAQILRKHGFKWLYAERTGQHVIPMASVIDEGDFAGHWRMDLEAMKDRRRPRGEA